MHDLLSYITSTHNIKILSKTTISGGSISSAYLLKTDEENYFLKTNIEPFALLMFQTEQEGLKAIENTNSISVPHVYSIGEFQGKSYLIMDYIESKSPTSTDFREFGYQLAKMHQNKTGDFGFNIDNYIGKLPQSNRRNIHWNEFYWSERIHPQLKMAYDKQLLLKNEIPSEDKALTVFSRLLGNPEPALIHGDLWSGNYLISSSGNPFLIDPATYYGDPMVDIAMSRLFGGFSQAFYNAYHEIIPESENYHEKIELYQLYFLLVHLNLFGSGYYSDTSRILKKYL